MTVQRRKVQVGDKRMDETLSCSWVNDKDIIVTDYDKHGNPTLGYYLKPTQL